LQARAQTRGEEVANSISHGIGFLLAIAAMPLLLSVSARQGHAVNMIGASVFASTMVLLYLISALYHGLPECRAKLVLQKLDYQAIFLFIAGSYTPFALGPLHGAWGWTLFGLVWAFAWLGVVLKAFDWLTHPIWSTGLYLGMGWLALIAAVPIVARIPSAGLAWLIAGGLAYTFGVVFYLTDARLRYGHLVWHLFVMTGTVCHFCAVMWYAA
jgi:hemolysin III